MRLRQRSQVGEEADGDEGDGEGQRGVFGGVVEGEEVVVDPEPGGDGLAAGSNCCRGF